MIQLRQFASLLALLVLTGCQKPLTDGIITSKDYLSPYTWTELRCVSYGKYGCQLSIPVEHYEPERYRVNMRGKNEAGDIQHDHFYVSPGEFERIEIGQHYHRSIK